MDYRMLIGGRLVAGAATLEVINPATGRVFATCARANEAQLNEAVAAAKAAFPGWAAKSIAERRPYLLAFADAIEKRFEEFARLLTEEQGKPLPQARFELGGALACLRFTAGMDIPMRTLKESAQERIVEQHTPLGVVATIAPWNFPVLLMMMKIAPAMLAGNTVVAKPAPTTPLTTLLLGHVAAETLPAGVLNTIVDRNDLGGLLTKHPDVAKVSFTGSTATGKKVMESVSGTLKRLTLELGGNDAAIVLDDVDPKEVAAKIFAAATMNAGQLCVATKRVYAPKSMYDELCGELAKLAKDAVVDDGLKQGTQIGPIQNKRQFEKVKAYLEDARANGKIVAGGEALDREGYFIPPTIVRDIPDTARLVCEEQFGPVLPILSYENIDDAIARANSTPYGLAGTIWSADPERGLQVALKVDSATLWVNKFFDLPFDVAVGGAKQSGIGLQQGQEGLEEFTQRKVINMAL